VLLECSKADLQSHRSVFQKQNIKKQTFSLLFSKEKTQPKLLTEALLKIEGPVCPFFVFPVVWFQSLFVSV
jgi:hypothetical protein